MRRVFVSGFKRGVSTETQRHKECRYPERLFAGFLCVSASLWFCGIAAAQAPAPQSVKACDALMQLQAPGGSRDAAPNQLRTSWAAASARARPSPNTRERYR